MIETINKIVRISRELVQDLGREPFPDEIADRMGFSVDKVRKILRITKEPISLETLSAMMRIPTSQTLSRTRTPLFLKTQSSSVTSWSS